MPLFLPFVILPGIAACSVAALRLGARAFAVIAGLSASLLILALWLPLPEVSTFFLPILFGFALGAGLSCVATAIRPEISIWTRMSLSLALIVAAGFLLLSFALRGT